MTATTMAGSEPAPLIRTVAAVIRDGDGRVLLVKKRGSEHLIQPGGKPEPGEAPLQTLRRELAEELGCDLVAGSARALGVFEDQAVHERGHRVRAEVFELAVAGTPAAGAEIASLHWVALPLDPALPIAPLSRHHILPRLR